MCEWRVDTGRLRTTVIIDRNNLTVGTDASLTCRVTDDLDGEDISIEWQKDGVVIESDNDEDRNTFDGPRLNIEKVIGEDAGEYTCAAVRGDEQVQSEAVTLNIQCE